MNIRNRQYSNNNKCKIIRPGIAGESSGERNHELVAYENG